MYHSISLKNKKQEKTAAFSTVLIKLLQGFITSEEKRNWEALLTYQEAVREYFSPLGLQLHLNTDDGYAFLRAGANSAGITNHEESNEEENLEDSLSDESDSATSTLPSLIRKAPLSFEVSLLCVLLREALEQFDSQVSDDQRFVMHRVDIYDLLKLFFPETTDEAKQTKRFDTLINRVIELGFLKELKGNQNSFEVRRMIKALFDAEKLAEIKDQMKAELVLNQENSQEMHQ